MGGGAVGRWSIVDSRWSVGGGRWAVGGGRWSVGSGRGRWVVVEGGGMRWGELMRGEANRCWAR